MRKECSPWRASFSTRSQLTRSSWSSSRCLVMTNSTDMRNKERDSGSGTSLNWETDPRWSDICRPYSLGDVQRLQGSVVIEHTFARRGAEKLWELLHRNDFVPALGALT